MAATAAMILLGTAFAVGAQDTGSQPAAGSASGSLVLFNQIQSLHQQMRDMQGQIEELRHQLQQAQQSNKDQYLDLDSRLGKLEHATPVASAPGADAAVASASSTHPAAALPPATADEAASKAMYSAALKTLREGNYVDSARSFRGFIAQYPQSNLVSNAYYWLGESYYVTQNFKIALAAFQTLLQKYPDSDKAPAAQLKVGYCQAGLKDYAAARKTLAAVIEAYPDTSVARLAKTRLAALPSAGSAN